MFADRIEAGRRLAERLRYLENDDVVVLGLPRGGVPVAYQIAEALDAPLDVIIVRKLGVPYQPELGMGAIGEGGVRIINEDVKRMSGITDEQLAAVEARERIELERRARRYRGDRPRTPLEGRVAVVVDDGIATGSTAVAACRVARALGADRVVLAVPVAPPGWTVRIGDAADEAVCVATPPGFYAIGQFYDDFTQTSDEEVLHYLELRRKAIEERDPPMPTSDNDATWPDPTVEQAKEEADGLEVFEEPYVDEIVLAEREEAEGVEVFEDPDAVIPAEALVEPEPGHETLVADQVGLGRDAGEDEIATTEEEWEY